MPFLKSFHFLRVWGHRDTSQGSRKIPQENDNVNENILTTFNFEKKVLVNIFPLFSIKNIINERGKENQDLQDPAEDMDVVRNKESENSLFANGTRVSAENSDHYSRPPQFFFGHRNFSFLMLAFSFFLKLQEKKMMKIRLWFHCSILFSFVVMLLCEFLKAINMFSFLWTNVVWIFQFEKNFRFWQVGHSHFWQDWCSRFPFR